MEGTKRALSAKGWKPSVFKKKVLERAKTESLKDGIEAMREAVLGLLKERLDKLNEQGADMLANTNLTGADELAFTLANAEQVVFVQRLTKAVQKLEA